MGKAPSSVTGQLDPSAATQFQDFERSERCSEMGETEKYSPTLISTVDHITTFLFRAAILLVCLYVYILWILSQNIYVTVSMVSPHELILEYAIQSERAWHSPPFSIFQILFTTFSPFILLNVVSEIAALVALKYRKRFKSDALAGLVRTLHATTIFLVGKIVHGKLS